MENETETTGENKKENKNKKQVELFTFFEVYTLVLFNGIFLVYGLIFWFCCHTYLTKNLKSCPWLGLFEVFTGLWLSAPTFCIKGYDYVKHFVPVLVLLVINTGCLKKFLKSGEHYIVDFQFNPC